MCELVAELNKNARGPWTTARKYFTTLLSASSSNNMKCFQQLRKPLYTVPMPSSDVCFIAAEHILSQNREIKSVGHPWVISITYDLRLPIPKLEFHRTRGYNLSFAQNQTWHNSKT